MKLKVQTLDAKAKGDIDLADDVFGLEPRADILHRVVTWQLENARGTARGARERADVARTGKKFGRQKGGGTARHGDRRAPVFIGGGKAHGPRVRDFNPSLNKKIRALGLKMALSAKAKSGTLIVLPLRKPRPRRLSARSASWALARRHSSLTVRMWKRASRLQPPTFPASTFCLPWAPMFTTSFAMIRWS